MFSYDNYSFLVVIKEPPYKVSEAGYASFTLPVEIYFRNEEEPKKFLLEYDLSLQLVGMPPLNVTKVEALTFLNPSEDFEKKLLKGGALILPSPVLNLPVGYTIKCSLSSPNPTTNEQIKSDIATPPVASNTSPSATEKTHINTPHSSKPKADESSHTPGLKRSNSVTEDSGQKSKKKNTDQLENCGILEN